MCYEYTVIFFFSGQLIPLKLSAAPTASAQKQDQFTLTYLNKGQHYALSINDTLCRDHELRTTISIAFHDHSHRQIASNFWKYWICQQTDAQTARAIDLGNIGNKGYNSQ